jgi:histidine ammonia-lyase
MDFLVGIDELSSQKLSNLAGSFKPHLRISDETSRRVKQSHTSFQNAKGQGQRIYGVTTGYGANVRENLDSTVADGLQSRLARYLDCGTGEELAAEECRAALIARTHILAMGYSGISPEVLIHLVTAANSRLAPCILRYGSLGASGDLVSLAPLARMLMGEPVEVWDGDSRAMAGPTLEKHGIARLVPHGRDTLALINGLSCVTALAALEVTKIKKLTQWSLAALAANHCALAGDRGSYDPHVNAPPVRNFKGQAFVAHQLLSYLSESDSPPRGPTRPLQDQYSLRCIPQALGPAWEMLEQSEAWIDAELQSVSDNPIVLSEGQLFNGGNFYGGYITAAADNLALALTRFADCLERQSFLLTDGMHGLPTNLAANESGKSFLHGLKGLHQICSALTMDVMRLSLPAAPFTRSSESHNQDIVSNAMNAVTRLKDLRKVFGHLVSASTLMSARALQLSGVTNLNPLLAKWHAKVTPFLGDLSDDRAFRQELKMLEAMLVSKGPHLD